MPDLSHEQYQNLLRTKLAKLALDPERAPEIDMYAEPILILAHLDLDPARPILERGYGSDRRSDDRWDPVVLLRCLLLGVLINVLSINKLAQEIRSSPVLRAIAGISPPPPDSRRGPSPCVGTLYNWLHRIHDGPRHTGPGYDERPSDNERRRAQTPRPPGKTPPKKRDKTAQKGKNGKPLAPAKAALALARACADTKNPDDLTQRLLDILWDCGVVESAQRGLLGNVTAMITAGDGCKLETNANGNGLSTVQELHLRQRIPPQHVSPPAGRRHVVVGFPNRGARACAGMRLPRILPQHPSCLSGVDQPSTCRPPALRGAT